MPEEKSPLRIVPVLLPIPAERGYSYAVPEGMELHPGDIVQVPLGPRQVAACVWDGAADRVDPKKLREVSVKFDCPPLTETMRRFVDWVAQYTLSPPGMVLRMVLRVPAAFDPEPAMQAFRYLGQEPERMTAARSRVLALARDGLAWSRSGLAHAAGTSTSVVDGLIKLGLFEGVEVPPEPAVPLPEPQRAGKELSETQQLAVRELLDNIKTGQFSATLLEGVTGSGKTEVYFEAIARVLAEDRQALILLPEIALTAAFLQRFEQRFGAPPAEWHSGMGPKRREKIWRQVASGAIRAVAGARSALFLPFCDPGIIVVDEEHDSAYKQEDRTSYHARDMAVVRAHITNIPVILASATPSIESKVNADTGRYAHVRLDKRFAEAQLPEIRVVDLRRNPPPRGKFLSPVLVEAITASLSRGEQALLFLNRRGYAPLTLCRVCGHRFECSNCSAWLVEHRFRNQLQCHHCGHSEPKPEACPACGTLDHLVACGPGVERVAEEVDGLFPDARTIVLASDMMGGAARLRLELEAIAKGEADIVIGTQLVAKGHHFPLMSCVGVVDADLGLGNGDPRAAERTFQLLSQVTGRAGRESGGSVGLLQTFAPENPVIVALASGDHAAFYEREIAARMAAALPPFGRLAAIIVSAVERGEAENHATGLRRTAPSAHAIQVLGPAEAPMALVRGRFRFRLLVHGQKASDLQRYLRLWLKQAPKERGSVRVQVDIDPQSFL